MWNNQICEGQTTANLAGICDTCVLCNRRFLYFCDELEEILKYMHLIHEAEHNFTYHSSFLLDQHITVVGSWDGKKLKLLLSPQNLCAVCFPPFMYIFCSTWLPIQLLDSQGMFFAPGCVEGDGEMPHRYHFHGLVFW